MKINITQWRRHPYSCEANHQYIVGYAVRIRHIIYTINSLRGTQFDISIAVRTRHIISKLRDTPYEWGILSVQWLISHTLECADDVTCLYQLYVSYILNILYWTACPCMYWWCAWFVLYNLLYSDEVPQLHCRPSVLLHTLLCLDRVRTLLWCVLDSCCWFTSVVPIPYIAHMMCLISTVPIPSFCTFLIQGAGAICQLLTEYKTKTA